MNFHPSGKSWILWLSGLGILWLAARGRLANAVLAAEGSGPYATSNGSSGSGGTLANGSRGTPGFPAPSVFGIPNSAVTSETNPTSMLPLDSQETQAWGGGPAAAEYDYLLSPGSHVPISLPGTSATQYTVLSDRSAGGVGQIETVQGPGGSILSFLHLASTNGAQPGAQLSGGTQVGMTGWPLSPAYGVGGVYGPQNALGAVIVNQAAQNWIRSHS